MKFYTSISNLFHLFQLMKAKNVWILEFLLVLPWAFVFPKIKQVFVFDVNIRAIEKNRRRPFKTRYCRS